MTNWITQKRKEILYKKLLIKQNYRCQYCGCLLDKKYGKGLVKMISNTPVLDHIIPQSKSGSHQENNLCLACMSCNIIKNNKTVEEFQDYLKPYLEGDLARNELCEFSHFKKMYNKYCHLIKKYF